MATEIVTWCDYCLVREDTRTTASVQASLTLGRQTLYLDICDEHALPLKEWAELGHPESAPMAKPVRVAPKPVVATGSKLQPLVACPWPGCRDRLKDRANAARHVWAVHHQQAKPDLDLTCPDCGFESAKQTGIVQHRIRLHDYDILAAALAGSVA